MSLYKRGLEKVTEKSSSVKTLSKKGGENSFKTDIDKFYHLVEVSSAAVPLEKVLEILDASAEDVEEWARMLEKQGFIEVVYTARGGTLYTMKGRAVQEKKFSFSQVQLPEISSQMRYVLIGVLLLLLVLVVVFSFMDFGEEREISAQSVPSDVIANTSEENLSVAEENSLNMSELEVLS